LKGLPCELWLFPTRIQEDFSATKTSEDMEMFFPKLWEIHGLKKAKSTGGNGERHIKPKSNRNVSHCKKRKM